MVPHNLSPEMKDLISKLDKYQQPHAVNYYDPTVPMYEEDPYEPVSA